MKRMVEHLDHAVACSLIGFDGITVGSYSKPDVELDSELMGAELSALFNQLRHSSTAQQSGEPEEFFYGTERFKVVFRVVTPDYFVALVLDEGGLVGKARYKLRLMEPGLKEELL